MEKTVIVMVASAVATKELSGQAFPFTPPELWTIAFILAAAFLTSISNEASKKRKGSVFVPARFWGNVGLGVMTGLAMPLLLKALLEHFTSAQVDPGVSIGLGVLGAYVGRDFLSAGWTALQAVGQFFALAKGVSVSFDKQKVPGGRKTPPVDPGGEDVDRS